MRPYVSITYEQNGWVVEYRYGVCQRLKMVFPDGHKKNMLAFLDRYFSGELLDSEKGEEEDDEQ